ncbi:aminotransferase class I/II-fold pyridoxal phosphate-dependent enzyme [Streptomyces sp. HNM0574]|uniref:aminotransferase class I/II-fold pyridoxal phosphate-dependent enzyme n=1 Tax=Streptomyces sp. HNM0574 TaxID=2714954 RepID=UPI00146EC833|nr:aminotransferase class I/II-fold pyridoxal phosphate-dependent enzyme [Streptomyces sp. HNM0574]NLU66066.1 aminotransferase class I/II-fold pyridoxal phosphate-dependent enzyme [Streptomyces sp. HNM0574]
MQPDRSEPPHAPDALDDGAPDAPRAAAVRAACGYWHRRGMRTADEQVVLASGAPLLLLALLAATGEDGAAGGGGVLLPRPGAAWHGAQARLLGRTLRTVPVPAESGGVPDPFALLETLRRARAEGETPRVLVLSVADEPTGTAVPPELLHEVCEVAVDEGLLIVSDESLRDTSFDPHDTVVVSPAEMLWGGPHPDAVVVLSGLGAALLPAGLYAGMARFPATPHGRELAAAVREVLDTLHTELSDPVARAAAEALAEPPGARERRAAGARARGQLARALHRAFTEADAVCRLPHLGRYVYADLEASRPLLAARGIADAAALEAELVRRLGPYALGGHRLGDDPRELRVSLSTDVLTPRAAVPSDPLQDPTVTRALESVRGTLTALTSPPAP